MLACLQYGIDNSACHDVKSRLDCNPQSLVFIDVSSLEDVFQRILSLNGSSEAFVNATLARPDFAILHQ